METDDNPQSVPSRCADKAWEALTEDGDDGVEPLHLARICRTTEAELPAQLFVVLVSAHAVPSREVLRRRRYLKALQQSVHRGLRVTQQRRARLKTRRALQQPESECAGGSHVARAGAPRLSA